MSNSNELKTTVTGRFIGGSLFQLRQSDDGKDTKYSGCIVLDNNEAKKINTIIKKAIVDKWGNKKPAGLQIWGVRDGDDPEYTASYEKQFINPKSTRKPQALVKRDGMCIEVDQTEGIIYPGCYVAAVVTAYAYDGDKAKNIKPGVTLNLHAVLFTKNGDRLDSQIDADEEFADFESGEIDTIDCDDDSINDDDFDDLGLNDVAQS